MNNDNNYEDKDMIFNRIPNIPPVSVDIDEPINDGPKDFSSLGKERIINHNEYVDIKPTIPNNMDDIERIKEETISSPQQFPSDKKDIQIEKEYLKGTKNIIYNDINNPPEIDDIENDDIIKFGK